MTAADPRETAIVFPLERDVVIVSGPDAAAYLQGQLSQDLEALAPGDSAWTFALAPSGKVDTWFRLSRREEDWVLDVDAGHGDALATRLTRFLLRTEAAVASVDWQAQAVRGPGADAAAAAPEGGLALDPAWPGADGVDLIGPVVGAPAGLATGHAEALEALRIESGVPAMGREMDQSTIPGATGVVDRSVSFTKGCFTGQELVARIESRGGSTPTRLAGVRAPAEAPLKSGSTLTVDGEEAGTVTSVARPPWRAATVALAYVKRAIEVPAEAEAEADPGGPVELVLLPPP